MDNDVSVVPGGDRRLGRRAALELVIAGGAGLLAACSTPAAAPTAAPAAKPTTAQAKPAEVAKPAAPTAAAKAPATAPPKPARATIRYGEASPLFVQAPLYMAKTKGFFEDENLDVQITHLETDPLILKALLANEFDIGDISTDGLLASIANGSDLKIFGTYASRMYFVLGAKKEIKDLKDLYGKSAAIAAPGGLAHAVTIALFDQAGADIKQVDLVTVGGGQSRYRALAGGKVDASVFPADFLPQVESDPNLHVLFVVAEKLPNYMPLALAAPTKAFAEKQDVLVRFMKAQIKGNRYALANKADVVKEEVARLSLPEDQIASAYDWYKKYNIWPADDVAEPAAIEYMQQLNNKVQQQTSVLPYDRVATKEITDRAIAALK